MVVVLFPRVWHRHFVPLGTISYGFRSHGYRMGDCNKSQSTSVGTFVYEYARPAVTVDAALVSNESVPQILLIKRGNAPFQNHWALPGGFVDEGEKLCTAAYRELEEETCVDLKKHGHYELRQVHTFGDPGRDPRGWTITVTFACVVDVDVKKEVHAADDAADAMWFNITSLPSNMAFDHKDMVHEVCKRILGWNDTPKDVCRAIAANLAREDPAFTGGVKNPE